VSGALGSATAKETSWNRATGSVLTVRLGRGFTSHHGIDRPAAMDRNCMVLAIRKIAAQEA
jgi:hypothetical protein